MNWEAIGAIGEMVGAISVIATLFYLALQVKHATSVARGATRQSVSQMNVDSLGFSLDSAVLSSAARKTTIGEELTPEEHSNYVRWVLARMRVFENAHYQYTHGLLEEDEWQGYAALIMGLTGPGSYGGRHWQWAAPTYSRSFVAEVQRINETAQSFPPAPSREADAVEGGDDIQ